MILSTTSYYDTMNYTAASFPTIPWSMQFLIANTPAKQDGGKAWKHQRLKQCLCSVGTAAYSAGIRHLSWSLLFCLFSVLSKEQGFTVVAVCVVFEFFIAHEVGELAIIMR